MRSWLAATLPAPNEAVVSFWPQQLGDWAGVIGDSTTVFVAITVLALWLRGRNPVVSYALKKDRQRTIGLMLAKQGYSRTGIRKACRKAVDDVLTGQRVLSVADELRWINDTARTLRRPVPVTLYGLGNGQPAHDLKQLSLEYRALAHSLKSRGLLGGGTAPILAEQADVAARTSEYLETQAMFAMGELPTNSDKSLKLRIADGATHIALDHLRTGLRPGDGVDDICVSHIHERLVVPETFAETLCRSDGIEPVMLHLGRQEDLEILDGNLTGKFFDGVLPRLWTAQQQRDPASGWVRLHLVLAEAAYSTVMATHNVGHRGIGRTRDELRGEARVLTLSCLPITSDGRIIAVRRSPHVRTGEGQIATGVNGNLEMRPRYGIAVDRDPYGLPDPRLAIAREAMEELGLDLTGHHFEILGTARFESEQEVGVTALLTACQLRLTAAEVSAASVDSHATEGRWESEGVTLAIPVPEDSASREEVLRWTVTNRLHQPHLTSALIAMCYPHLMEELRSASAISHYLQQLAASPPEPALPAGTIELIRSAAA
jgi:hypothetical protein